MPNSQIFGPDLQGSKRSFRRLRIWLARLAIRCGRRCETIAARLMDDLPDTTEPTETGVGEPERRLRPF